MRKQKNNTKKISLTFMLTTVSKWVLLFLMKPTRADLLDLDAMLEKIEGDTRKFVSHFETLLTIENKCSNETKNACITGNYDDCTSEYPEASCPGNEYSIPICGDGKDGGCGALFDFTASTVRLAPTIDTLDESGNPISLKIQETMCTTLQADTFMKRETVTNSDFWSEYSVSSPFYHYGADDGVFRIYPGNPKSCPNDGVSDYDPRLRPWYVAASSGPKDLVLLIDTSGSMREYGRMDLMKEAVIRVINTLSVSDYVAVVPFNTDAYSLAYPPNLIQATDENKELLIQDVQNLSPSGRTDFYKAFSEGFDILKRSADELELTANCHKAILFLTDGEFNSDIYTEEQLFDLVDAEMAQYTIENETRPVIFSYSFGGSADETIPKKLACSYDGIWAQIEDDGDLAESMGGFYKYFAYGLGDETNEDFVAWVSPYEFATGIGLGTTASAPVYDRSVDPPVLAGVVGMDLSFAALERALGPDDAKTRTTVIERLAMRSQAKCPLLQLSTCQLESLRYWGGEMGSKGLCYGNEEENTCDLTSITSTTCDDISRLDVWNNHFNEGRSYTERLCCSVGETRMAGNYTHEEIKNQVCSSGAAIPIELIVGVAVGVVILFASVVFFRRRKNEAQQVVSTQEKITNSAASDHFTPEAIDSLPVAIALPSQPGYDIAIIPLPTAEVVTPLKSQAQGSS